MEETLNVPETVSYSVAVIGGQLPGRNLSGDGNLSMKTSWNPS
jgi:hypothetical protein